MSKLSATAAVAVVLGFAAATAMAQEDWSAWDTDGDAGIDYEEFAAGFGENDVFGDWDGDGDGLLSEDEFNEGVFNSYDTDDSGVIEEPEFGDLGDDMGDGGFWDV